MFINEVPSSVGLSSVIINELRDMYDVKYRKDKKLKNQNLTGHQKIFGVPLKQLEFTDVKLSNGSLCRIPTFVSDACSYIMDQIEVEGIFRKAGSSSRQKEIRGKLESGIPFDDTCNVVDIANILKYFFRELPEPLLPPGNFQETILRCLLCKGSIDRKITAIKMVCLLLPIDCLNLLIYFMQFLNLVSVHSASNKMTAKNLAIIFAPGLMPINESYGQRLNSHVQVIEILIQNAHDLGIIGTDLMNRLPNLTVPDNSQDDLANFTIISESSQMKMTDTDVKKKKKRRSGSLTRVFNGIRKIVGAIGSSENLDVSHESEMTDRTPCIAKTKKRKVLEASAFSSKKKKDLSALLPSGGILPSTPMHTAEDKPAKKTRLSLGGKRYTKNRLSGTKSSIVSSLERRWSFMVAGTSGRQAQNQDQDHKQTLNPIEDVTFTSPTPQEVNASKVKDAAWEAQITQSEYEEIKGRVSAIETRISKEFVKLRSSLSTNSLDSIDLLDDRDGPERVLEKFERTVEETEMMNTSPMTEQLAKHLSRGLKIRSSAETKVYRSPSARKIGSIRRRSQDNVRLSRNKSIHLASNIANSSPRAAKITRITRNSPLQPVAILKSPNVEKHIQIPRANLKRGKPNTFPNGLRPMQQLDCNQKTIENTFTASDNPTEAQKKNECSGDLQNENWISASVFFDGFATPNHQDENAFNTSKNSAKSSATRVKPARKRLNVDVTPTNQRTQPQSNLPVNDTTKTPMLPPRLPIVKKTPSKTPHQSLSARKVFTPLCQHEQQQQIAGRASIARLRNQNAGMVMAKAKLFDNLVNDDPKPVKQTAKSDMRRSVLTNATEKQTDKSDTSIGMRFIQNNQKSTDSPRRNKFNNANDVQRRQQLKAQRHTPIKKTPIVMTDKSLVTFTETVTRSGRIVKSPGPLYDTSIQSPITRRMASIDATPCSKRTTLIAKPPRRLVRTPQKRKPN